jgi:UDP-glucose 4-epimerase
VLVTGGAGFIGSHVGERFMRDGFDVRVLDDLSTGFAHNCHASWELLREDVRDRDAVEAAVADCDVVVHLAAFTSVPESFERFAECYRVNVHGTYNVIQACASAGVGKLVFASSSAVYAELPDAPKSEADCPEPISPYAVSKLEGEHLLELVADFHGLASVALRFFNVYGPRQPADSAYAAAVPIFMERGLRGEQLTVYGDGRQTRDFVFVGDVADAVYRAACSEVTGVFNVGTGKEIQVVELANLISELTGAGSEHHFEPLRPGDVRSSTAEIGRIAEGFGWVPGCSLQEGLLETLTWYRERHGGPAGS